MDEAPFGVKLDPPTPSRSGRTAAKAAAQAKPAAPTKPAASAATSAPGKAPAAAADPKSLQAAPAGRRRVILFAAGGAALLVIVAVALFAWRPWQSAPPRLNEAPAKIASYVGTAEFAKLPFERQVVYFKQMADKEDSLVEAYRAGTMTEDDYRKSLQAAYLGRQLTRAKKYAELPAGAERTAYLDKLLNKKLSEKALKRGEKVTPKVRADGTVVQPALDAKDAADVKDVDRDDTQEAAIVKTWPPEAQQQWNDFRKALRDRKRARKEQELQELRERANAASQPAAGKK